MRLDIRYTETKEKKKEEEREEKKKKRHKGFNKDIGTYLQ